MFKLKRPCENCPFKRGQGEKFQLHPERLEEIRCAPAFQCHKTIDYDQWDDRIKRQGEHPQQCAGLMSILARAREPNTIMRIAMKLGYLDPALLDPDNEAYVTWQDALSAHGE